MNAPALRVLVVDDEDMVRSSLRLFLEDEGFDVRVAPSAEDALVLLREEPVDVAIVDIRLPGRDGNTLILEAHQIRPALRYLIHTGSTNYVVPPEAEQLGVRKEHVFLKPLHDMTPIARAIRRMCRHA